LGKAGSGKTLLAVQIALDMYFKRRIDKIIMTRPTVSNEDNGFLPGSLQEKMDPWLAPVYSNLYLLYNREKVDKMVANGEIEMLITAGAGDIDTLVSPIKNIIA
jgi:phosphate starvation-inducible PhoH-like protein